jgi:hypothetical protein
MVDTAAQAVLAAEAELGAAAETSLDQCRRVGAIS